MACTAVHCYKSHLVLGERIRKNLINSGTRANEDGRLKAL